ncbi:hypothetical protein M413DRAFT_446877 [Hebeloma cylindrosporum]|uniref:F-box domain-containing protein n=1 Tax=Hebeloma cylindrosporum TaxID=76867 RepID=A0A0C2XQT2_HEBCY|nr:hypothetical protein M413DRAFT_446877 [Hebeloma cylindrosporum h7]
MNKMQRKQFVIPQEIIDQFIDHLYHDRGALKACALACRSWVSSSRYHLFGIIALFPLGDGEDGRFSGLLGVLDHPLCTFASSVRTLCISTDDEQNPTLPPPTWAESLIPGLAKLVSVKSLIAFAIGGRRFGWGPLFSSTTFITQITHLRLECPDFITFEDFTGL